MESLSLADCRPRRLSRYRELVEDKYGLLSPYKRKFEFEDKDTFDFRGWFDSDDDDDIADELHIADVHGIIKRFLQQVRESGGYDLDCCPPKWFHVPFRPVDVSNAKQNDVKFYNELIHAAQFAINEINAEMSDRSYKLLEVEKVVVTSTWTKLLTFTAMEEVVSNDVDVASCVKTIQAMVHEDFDYSLELEQWRYKPLPLSMEV